MTSSARSLQPLDGQPKLNPPPTFNPNPVIKPPLMPQDPKMQKMASSVEQQKELLRQLKEQKERTERELAQNQLMMSQRVQSIESERAEVEKLILKSTVTIQRLARGFITRLKLRKFKNLEMELERARLDEALSAMQVQITTQA